MLNMRRNRTTDTVETGADGAPADDSALGEPTQRRLPLIGIGMQVAALIVVGILMIAGLALVGDARLAATVAHDQSDRRVLDSDRADVSLSLANAQRAEAMSAGFLDSFSRAGQNIILGRAVSAAADAAERSLTDFAQSLQTLDNASRTYAVAAAKSFYLRAWDETVENAQEASFIRVNRERVALILKTTQELPAALAGIVLDNQETMATVRGGNVADAREIFLTRQAPKIAGLDQSLVTIRTAMIDFSADMATRHAGLSRAIETDTQNRYDDQRQSIRLQILLLVLVLCAGGALIAIYGLAIPLADLAAAAGRFAQGRFEVPTTVLGRRDELGRLSSALERLRETIFTEKQAETQKDHEQKEADRLSRMTLEREVQQLRRDRDRLEKERAEREQADSERPQISPETIDRERATLRAELAAEADRKLAELGTQYRTALDQANAEVARLTTELEKQKAIPAPAPVEDKAQREALDKAHAEIIRLSTELLRLRNVPPSAPVEDKAQREALEKAQAEITRLIAELQKARNVPPPAPVENKAQREALEKAQAEITRLTAELGKARATPAPVVDPNIRDALAAARTEAVRLRNEQTRERAVARKAATDAAAQLAAATAAAAELRISIAAAEEDKRRLGSELAFVKQLRDDELENARTNQARAVAETEHRLGEQYADRLQVLSELANSFESSIANAMTAVQHASDGVRQASDRIGDAAQRSTQYSGETAERVGRASTSIHAAATAAEQIATAIDEIARQSSQSSQVAGNAVVSARAAIDAVQALEGAANRMNEAGAVLNDIAERTNVLSLNATIEAARAGDSGKGFVVVAAEIKSLANRAGRTAKELAERVKAVASATGSVRTAFTGVSTALTQIETLSATTTRDITQQGATARTVVQGVHAAADGTDGIGRALGETNASVASAGHVVAQAHTASDILTVQAQELRKQIDEFLAAIRAA